MGKKKTTQTTAEVSGILEPTKKTDKALNYKIAIKCRNQHQKDYLKLLCEKEIVFCSGEAGCGKTYVAIAKGLALLQRRDNSFNKIYLITSSMPSEENLGFLPGTVDEKLLPSMMSFLIVIDEIVGRSAREQLFNQHFIEFMPMSYLRGVNLKDCIVIGDELQNMTVRGMKTLLTRISENCKMWILGDVEQIDHPKLTKDTSGLSYMTAKVKENPDDRIGVMEFSKADIVRNPIIEKILDYFNPKPMKIVLKEPEAPNKLAEAVMETINK